MPEPSSPPGLVLRDDLPAPDGFDAPVPDGATLLVAVPDGLADAQPSGLAVVSGDVPVLTLDHLRVPASSRGRGLGRAVEGLVRVWAVARGATVLTVDVPHDLPAVRALARGSRVLGASMTRPAVADPALPEGFGWRAMTPVEFGPWHERQVQAYAEENLARTGGDLDRALARSRTDFATALPDGLATADTSLVVLTAAGEPVGHLWLAHHRPGGQTFGFELEILPSRRRQGWGRAAIALAGKLASEGGDTVLGLHVFGDNAAARLLYESSGFTVRSTKHDLLSRA